LAARILEAMERPLLCAFALASLPAAALASPVEIEFQSGRLLVAESVRTEGRMTVITLEGGGMIGLDRAQIDSIRELPALAPGPAPAAPPPDESRLTPSVERLAPPAAVPAEGELSMQGERDQILALIGLAARRHGVDRDLLQSLIEVESSLDPGSVSPEGAMGLAQLMPATADDLGVTDPFDPAQAVDAAARHLRALLELSGGEFVGALAAYNAGQGAVNRYGGLPPYDETIRYIEKVLKRYAAP